MLTFTFVKLPGGHVTALLSRFLSKPPYGGSISFMLDNALSILIKGRMSADTSSPFSIFIIIVVLLRA